MQSLRNYGNSIRIGRKEKGERRKAKERLKIKDGNVRLILLVIFLLFPFFRLSPFAFRLDAQSFQAEIYQAYITGNMDHWEKSLQGYSVKPSSPDALYDLTMAYYGFIGYCLGKDQKSRAKPYLNQAEIFVKELLGKYPDNPRFLALQGALYGFRLIYQPQKMMSIGPKSLKEINRAIEIGPDCPEALVESGNKDWFMPGMFGGSRERAIEAYKKAISLLERNPGQLQNNWYYLNLHMSLAGWYEERNMTYFANELYRKVLKIEPKFSWAAEKLKK